jgi:2-keto-4-pentenoate hydratase/2-oxohepta-3-ene-1,7-dioic acid hydratase in catechol pathway
VKLVLFDDDYRLGVVDGDGVIDVTDALGQRELSRPQESIETVIRDWSGVRSRIDALADRGERMPLAGVRLRAPVPRPPKIVCAAVNYLEFGQREPADFDAFLKSPTSVLDTGGTVVLPPVDATVFHHEAELGVVIGKTTSNVNHEEALGHVFGYLQFLDMSARGLTPNGRGSFFLGKSWDTFGPMGPALVTADEVSDPQALQVRLWNNGEPRHDYPTSDMALGVAHLIEAISRVVTLEPGDVVATGVNHQQIGAVQDGDELRMEIEGFGPPLVVGIRDERLRTWPRGIDTAVAELTRGAR